MYIEEQRLFVEKRLQSQSFDVAQPLPTTAYSLRIMIQDLKRSVLEDDACFRSMTFKRLINAACVDHIGVLG